MKKTIKAFLRTGLAAALVLTAGVASAQDSAISGARMRADVRFLASDLLEGRGVGARGGQLAEEYLAAQFAVAGALPGAPDGTYFQPVPLLGVTTLPSSKLSVSSNGKTIELRWLEDFVGGTNLQREKVEFDSEAVFVGHGITAPEYQWDDYKGADVRGKVVVLFTNEPQSDEKLFGGKALTYYGRWTYKYEEAARRGAAAVIIIHTTPTAGYGWQVVRSSWGRERPQVRLEAGARDLALASWVTQEAGERLLSLAGTSTAEMLKAAGDRSFRPIPLGFRVRGSILSTVREIRARNVIARVEGSDPMLAQQAVLFTAHHDHLGIGEPVNGDNIYNGAVDNATGCAILLEIARAWASLPKKPRRTAYFVAVTAEESGLLGSEYFGKHPPVPAGRIAAAFNFDGYYPFGRTTDIVVNGAERTTLWDTVRQVAARMKLEIKPDPRPEQGSYFRSDHFPLAKVGIPAFSISMGTSFAGKPPETGEQIFREFNTKHYHQPSDEYREDWDFAGLEMIARLGMALGVEAAGTEAMPGWRPGDPYQKVREASLK